MTNPRTLRAAGIAATLAGLAGGTGDLLLFYTPGFAADLFAVRVLPTWRIVAGTLLAISVIPLLALGYWMLSRYLRGAGQRFADAIFVLGIYGAGIGNAIHGVVGVLVQVVQRNGVTAGDAAFTATYAPYVVPLYVLFYVIMAVGSIALAIVIWRGKTAYPRWMIALLPLWSNVLVVPLAAILPALGDVLTPSIANLSHALLFGVVTALFWGREGAVIREEAGDPPSA
jgi:hypothetical protein